MRVLIERFSTMKPLLTLSCTLGFKSHQGGRGNKGWGSDEVLRYSKKWEKNNNSTLAKDTKYHSTTGEQSVAEFPYVDINEKAIIEAFHELGYPSIDINGANQTGVCRMQHFQKNGLRESSASAFLYPIRYERKNLKIVTNVRVTKILIDAAKKLTKGVEYVWENNRNIKGKLYAKKEVILSAGPMASPQLLMLSGIGPKETLEPLGIKVIQELPVGKNLQNHIRTGSINFTLTEDRVTVPADDEAASKDLLQYLTKNDGPLSTEGSSSVTAFIPSRYKDTSYPDIQVYFGPRTQYMSNDSGNWDIYLTPMSYYNVISAYIFVMTVGSTGHITINTTDPFSYPLIYPNFFSDEKDMDIVIDGYNFIVNNLSKSEVLKKNGLIIDKTPLKQCNKFKYASDDYWKCDMKYNTASVHHFSGTCKMGPKGDKTAVVDPELKVHNIKGLRVVDTSIQPSVVNGNTNSIALTIGEKAADMIKTSWLKTIA